MRLRPPALTTMRPKHKNKRGRNQLFAGLLVAIVAVTAGCTSAPPNKVPAPSPTLTQYPPQPAFTTSTLTAVEPAAAASNSSIAADVSAPGTPIDVSRFLNASQGGYQNTQNLHWLGDQAAQMSSMGLNEIRVDHIFDDSTYHVVNKDESGQITYDFSALDSVLLGLVNNGLQPFLTISFTPSALGGSLYGPPSSMEEWSAAVTALVSHYRDLGYTGWGYEVWNEIDTNHWRGTIEQYGELYAVTASAVKAADPTALVGGAAASGLTSAGNWSGQFIDFLGAHPDVPADFFSVHSYWSDQWVEGPNARALLDAAGRPGLPIFLTEWNNQPEMTQGAGKGSDTNASPSGSSYVAKRLFRAITSEASKFFYFTPMEGLMFNLPYNGDLGLITVDGHRKSSGNVFEMYSHLGSTQLPSSVAGPGSETEDLFGVVTKDEDGTAVSAILWNHTPTDATMSVSLTGLPYKKSPFRVQKKVVSATLGNGFADGSTTVLPSYPSANENAPIVSDELLDPANAYTKDILVPANGVVSLALAPSDAPADAIAPSSEPSMTNIAAAASGATAISSSSVEDESKGWGASRLNDGRRHSFEFGAAARGWSSASHAEATANEAIQVDLGAVKPVDTVVLWPRDSQTHDGAGFPNDFIIQGSVDGATWDTVFSAEGYATDKPVSGPQTFGFPAAEYQFLRVEATSLTDGARSESPEFAFQLTEFEAYRTGVVNGGFETGALDEWKSKGDVTVQALSVRSGQQAAQLTGKKASISMLLTGLLPDTTYTFGGHVRPETRDDAATFSVSEYGGDDVSTTLTTPQWGAGWVTFTTGPKNTSAMLELSKPGGAGSVWADDFIVTQQAPAPEPAPATPAPEE